MQASDLTNGVNGSGAVVLASGNAATATLASTVTTNANLSGVVTSSGNSTSFGSFSSSTLATALSDETGTGLVVFNNSPTLVTPVLGAATGTSVVWSGQDTASNFAATGSGANTLPVGTTGARPGSPVEGMIRDNTTLGYVEAYLSGTWKQIGVSIINLATQVTGTLPVANGGTSCTTASCYYGLPNIRAKLAQVKTATQGTVNARICMAGDSTFFGSWSQPSNTNIVATSMPMQLSSFLNSTYGIKSNSNGFIGDQGIYETYGGSGIDPRISMGSSWTQDSSTISLGGSSFKATTATNSLSFTPSTAVNVFRFLYITQSGGGVLSVNIDGGTATTYNTSGSAGIAVATLTAGSVGTHTINFSWSSGGQVNVVGVSDAYDNTQNWVDIINMGWPGAFASDWATSGSAYNPGNSVSWAALGCDLVMFEAGINDWNNGVSLTTYNTNMTTILSAITGAATGDTVLVTPVPSLATAQATQLGFVQKMYALAQTYSLPIVDIYDRWGKEFSGDTLGLYAAGGGNIHPNSMGYGEEALAISQSIAAAPGSPANPLGFTGSSGSQSSTFSSPVTINGTTNNTVLTLSGSNAVGTQIQFTNSSSGAHTANLATGGSTYPGWFFEYDNTSNANIFGGTITTFNVSASSAFGFTSSSAIALSSADTAISRISAGVLGVGTGAQGSVSGTIVAAAQRTSSAGRAVNTGTTSDTIAAGISSTYESANSATTTLTFAAPTSDGERRRVCLKNAATVTWAVTSPATAVAGLPTTFAAGQCVEAVYNSASGTPANAPATTWVVY